MREQNHGSHKFYRGGISLYPRDVLYKEMAFIAYYFHWDMQEIMGLDHRSRLDWCREISYINEKAGSSEEKKEKSILEFRPD